MLKILRRIVQEVSSAKSLAEALNTLVVRVKEAVDTQTACVGEERCERVLMRDAR